MPTKTEEDGSEDVNDFLLRIKELGDQRDKEDEERTRKLEEEIIQGRKERQARRAERARSLSPTKDTSSNAGTPGSVRSRNDMSMQEDLSRTPTLQRIPSPRNFSQDEGPHKTNGAPQNTKGSDTDEGHRKLPPPPSKPQTLFSTNPGAAMAPSRSNTLSWQQRPSSRGLTGPRARPLSMMASENRASRSPRQSVDPEPIPTKDDNVSRSQIAQSLEAKDPMWFRQTQERGQGSAAYRRNQDDPANSTTIAGSMRLPGMSRESTAEPESRISPPPESIRSSSPLIRETTQETSDLGSSAASTSSISGIRSPLPTMSSQRFEPPSSDTTSTSGGDTSSTGRVLAMSPAQGRISPERVDRPSSPTKGLGGFVQSAMMKRSDSVNKRWSAQAGPGLSRGNSIASNASAYTSSRYPVGGVTPLSESRPSSLSRDNSPALNSRPGSSHSNATVTQGHENDRPGTSTSTASNKSETNFESKFPKPTLGDEKSPPADEAMSPPASPSKRWSPAKASWLENAINKPDSPKFKSPAPQQPAWMADINRAKQQRGSVDLGKGNNFKEVSIGGLVRSPPLGAGYKVPGIGGLPSGFSAGVAAKPRKGSLEDINKRSGSPEPKKAEDLPSKVSSFTSQSITPSKPEIESVESAAATQHDEKAASASPAGKKVSQEELPSALAYTSKAKPETPPKKDFRTSLKPRPDSGELNSKDEPEFKNVFGKLKRTQTQNYKAPDELKENIMRGKSGLAQTGGPKKTERKDEFKESILQKKQGMVAPSASTRITSASSKTPNQSTPEAIAKRNGLTRSDSIVSNGSGEGKKEKELSKPEALAKLQHLRDKPKPMPPERPASPPAPTQRDSGPNGGLGGNFASSLAGVLQRGPSPMAGKPGPDPTSDKVIESRATSRANDEGAASRAPQLTHATKARARGPKRRLPTASTQVDTPPEPPEPQEFPAKKSSIENETTSDTQKHTSSFHNLSKHNPRPLSNITHINNNNRKVSQPNSPRKPSTSIAQPQDIKPSSPISQSPIRVSQAMSSPTFKQKPTISPKDEKIRTVPLSQILKSQPESPLKPRTMPVSGKTESDMTPAQREPDPEPQEIDGPLPSVKGAAALWGQSPKPTKLGGPRSPVKLPTRKDEEAAQEEAGLRRKECPDSELKASANGPSPLSDKPPSSPAAQSPKSPPLPGKKSASIANRVISATLHVPPSATMQSNTTVSSQPPQAAELLANIFDTPSSKQSINVDTQVVLDARSSNESSKKIKTLRKQIFEITDNGRSVPVPTQQEHILFEDSLYLCTHVFGTLAGQRTTEVYLWCGDGVSPSAVNDAQIFAKKATKDSNGKLIVLKQGKETTNFFQALGGIVITRRGSGRAESSATSYILCGRQHVGQIAFDEVDFHPQSLCHGFPYIVSTPGGKLYLWKGRGSGADELGCARLIGMDLGLTGDIEEVDDGKETNAFWQSLGGKPKSEEPRIQHWHLKPSCEKYTNRLLSIDVEMPRPKSSSGFMQWGRRGSAPSSDANAAVTAQIKEIVPFAQSDLVDDGVFVLDAFFEVFVILTVRTLTPAPQHKLPESSAFRAALLFAQEYSVLVASAEDRPFVPVSSVVICSRIGSGNGKEVESVPGGVKRAFRKWNDDCVKECRVLSLTAALEVTGA